LIGHGTWSAQFGLEFVPAAKMVWLSDLVKFAAGGALGAILMKYLPRMHE
jgi:hypothetical protein